MLSLRLLIVAMVTSLAVVTPTLAQGTQQNTKNRPQHTRTPVATQPSNSPFQNPIGQGVPPAVSANPNLNSTRTNPPR